MAQDEHQLIALQCDLVSPACTPCVKRGLQCPGYGLRLHVPVGRNGSVSEAPNNEKASTVSKTESRRTSIIRLPLSTEDSLRNEFIFKMTFGALSARPINFPERTVLAKVPRHIGRSQALDAAAKLLCIPPRDDSDTLGNMTELRYAVALYALQRSIGTDGLSAEVMASSALLQMYEIAGAKHGQRWRSHANAVVKMIEHRAPSESQSELEKAIIRSQWGYISVAALRDSKTCFLADERWQHARLTTDPLDQELIPPTFQDYASIGVRVPGLLCSYESLKAAQAEKPHEPFDIEGLAREVRLVSDYLKAWRESLLSTRNATVTATPSNQEAADKVSCGKRTYYIIVLCTEFIARDLACSIKDQTVIDQLSDLVGLNQDCMAHSRERFHLLVLQFRQEVDRASKDDPQESFIATTMLRTLPLRIVQAYSPSTPTTEMEELWKIMQELVDFMDRHLAALKAYA